MFFKKLSTTTILWLSFTAFLAMTAAFQVIVPTFDLILLDAISNPDETKAAIATMTPHQREVHAWMTATLDVAYPMAYGALFVGSAYCFFPTKARLLAIPSLICVPVDLIEGVVQVLALVDALDLTQLKAILTPVKQLTFVSGMLITMAGWTYWLVARLRGQTN